MLDFENFSEIEFFEHPSLICSDHCVNICVVFICVSFPFTFSFESVMNRSILVHTHTHTHTRANKEKPSLFIQPHTAALTGHFYVRTRLHRRLKELFTIVTTCFFNNTVLTKFISDIWEQTATSLKKEVTGQTALNKPPGSSYLAEKMKMSIKLSVVNIHHSLQTHRLVQL